MTDLLDISTRLGAACILGTLIGLDRERKERSAGLRTHALVSVGSALFMIVSAYGFEDPSGGRIGDPGRVAAQVVSGVGFLGAGTIILRKDAVKGLTTAASVWTVAGVGLACGVALYNVAIIATVLALIILVAMKPLSDSVPTGKRLTTLHLQLQSLASLPAVVEAVQASRLRVEHLHVEEGHHGHTRVEIAFRNASEPAVAKQMAALRALSGVLGMECRLVNAPLSSPDTGDPGPSLEIAEEAAEETSSETTQQNKDPATSIGNYPRQLE